MIKKLSGKKLSSWLKVACKSYLLASDEYDKLGQYSLSQEVYDNVLRLSSLIRLSEDEDSVEEDVDFKILDSDSVNEDDVSEINVIERNNQSGNFGYYNFSYPTIEMFVRLLRQGGRNVFNCLDIVAKDKVVRFQADDDFFDIESESWEKANLSYALAWHFNNNLFAPNPSNLDAGQVIDDIWTNRVSIDTVACFARVEKENQKNAVVRDQGREQIKQLIGQVFPEFREDRVLQNYFLPPYLSGNLTSFEIVNFDIENYKRFKLFLSRVVKPIRSDFMYGIMKFLSKYPSDLVFEKAIEKINNSNNYHDFTEYGLERIVFGGVIEISNFVTRTEYFNNLSSKILKIGSDERFEFYQYNFLSLLYPEDQALKIYYDAKKTWPDVDVKREWKNGSISEPEQKYVFSLPEDDEDEDEDESSDYRKNSAYPYLNAFSRVGGKDGERVFQFLYSEVYVGRISYFDHCYNYMIPVYVKYFIKNILGKEENIPTYISENLFRDFTKFYSLVGENIYNYSLYDIFKISDNYSNVDLELKSGAMSIEKFQYIKDNFGDNPFYENMKTLYYIYPFAYNIPMDKILDLRYDPRSDSTLRSLYESDDQTLSVDKLTIINHQTNPFFSAEIKKLFLGSPVNQDYFPSLCAIDPFYVRDNTKDILVKILSQDNIIGNLDIILRHVAVYSLYPDLSPSEFFFCSSGSLGKFVDVDKVKRIREEFQKHSKYREIEVGSDKYNKIFGILANNFAIRGTDPDLLEKLHDIAVIGRASIFTGSPNLFFAASIIGTNNFKYMNAKDIISINNCFIHFKLKEEQLCEDLKLKPEWIISLGGFEKFFNMSDSELVKFANSHRILSDSEVQELRSNRGLYISRGVASTYSSFLLKCDKNILKNKLTYISLKKWFDENPVNIENLQNKEYKNTSIIDGSWIRHHYTKFMLGMDDEYFCGKDCDQRVQELYGMQVPLYKELIYPEHQVKSALSNVESTFEGINNLSKIVQVFRKFTNEILNAYSKEECKSKGYPVRGFDAIPDIRLKERIIHDLANLLPDNLPEKPLVGYAQYFYNNFLQDKKNSLRIIGNTWNSVLNIYDSDYNIVSTGTVASFSSQYNIVELAKYIQIDSFTKLITQLDVKNKEFGFSFAENMGVSDQSGNISSSEKVLYKGLEEVYIQGLSVPMPSWSSFSGTIDGMTLKFIPRKDARGMFLGNLTNCCQHPKAQAASCAYDGHLNPLACFAVFEVNNELIFQSYVWSDEEGNVCFDSIETANRNYYKQENLISAARLLMKKFSSSISGRCVVGNNRIELNDRLPFKDLLKNPTTTNNLDHVSNLLITYSINRNDRLYTADSSVQYLVPKS